MNWNQSNKKQLVEAIILLKTPDETKKFLRDLLTESEINEFAKRLEAAEMLSRKAPYSKIVQKTGLSSTTVARVSKWLNGKEGGYASVISKLHHNTSTRSGRVLS